ncbi:hypothetical protein BPO_0927 [Bergeyella porcorum]|uniref:Uncharacterized protein n=1 Tax=Bergeyella porcorum TaxID=1735111 RepID=A0AAU0EZ10_9FLAO
MYGFLKIEINSIGFKLLQKEKKLHQKQKVKKR